MIFDTDIFVWIQHGNKKAAALVDKTSDRFLSIYTYMELMQCANNKDQHRYTKEFIKEYGFSILSLTENIGHRASVYIDEYSLNSSLRAGDAIIAATSIEHNMILATGNKKHFNSIKDLQIKIFYP